MCTAYEFRPKGCVSNSTFRGEPAGRKQHRSIFQDVPSRVPTETTKTLSVVFVGSMAGSAKSADSSANDPSFFPIWSGTVPTKPTKTLFVVSVGTPPDQIQKNSVDGTTSPAYAELVAKKEATGFSSSIRQRRTTAPLAVFFRPCLVAPSMSGDGGRLRPAGFLCHRSANPSSSLTPFSSGLCGFKTDKEAIMPSTITPAISHTEQIRRLAGIADTIGAMLGVFEILPPTGQDDAIAVSASLADDLAQALAALNGGAA